MARCAAIKPNGERCTRIVGSSLGYCYSHDPNRSEERIRNASKAGSSKPNRELQEVKSELRDIADKVLRGELDTRKATAAVQALNCVIRGIEVEYRNVKLDRAKEELNDILDIVERGG